VLKQGFPTIVARTHRADQQWPARRCIQKGSNLKITAARGAIAITLDRPRILFFDLAGTWLLVQRYGAGFVRELYSLEKSLAGRTVKLKSTDALRYFLWAGLQAEISDTGEVLTEEDAAEFIHPWTLENIFNALVMAITGAISTPAPPGKPEASAPPPSPPATSKKTKASTSARRNASRAAA
jgi:hypothetical protein